ncbi:MAG TPA: carbonate dehydratase [Gammaproteobacteria bacterium]|nr:carbonate dehydratase [Gammaproteobacteria bacterium]
MRHLEHLFANNRKWAQAVEEAHPGFFQGLASQQAPQYLWIGCSDSRVPANEIVGLQPGELFVHRNVANIIVHSDLNALSVLQYAVEVLQVRHVIVCGHYGCGGVRAAMEDKRHGLIDNWLCHIKDIYELHVERIDALETEEERCDLLCELNVIEQVNNLAQTTIIRDAWLRKQPVTLHGWIYSIQNGLLKDLEICVDAAD